VGGTGIGLTGSPSAARERTYRRKCGDRDGRGGRIRSKPPRCFQNGPERLGAVRASRRTPERFIVRGPPRPGCRNLLQLSGGSWRDEGHRSDTTNRGPSQDSGQYSTGGERARQLSRSSACRESTRSGAQNFGKAAVNRVGGKRCFKGRRDRADSSRSGPGVT